MYAILPRQAAPALQPIPIEQICPPSHHAVLNWEDFSGPPARGILTTGKLVFTGDVAGAWQPAESNIRDVCQAL